MASQYLGQQVDRDGLGMVDVLPALLILLYGTCLLYTSDAADD